MISEIYTPLVERRSINKYLGVLTKKNYKAEMRKLFDKSQLLGEELEDNQVNEYATSFMAKHLRSGEVMLDKQEQRNLCSQYNLDAYESLIRFPEYLALFEKHPEFQKDNSEDLMRAYKLITGCIQDFYEIPNSQIKNVFSQYNVYCDKFRYNKRSYYRHLWNYMYSHGIDSFEGVGDIFECHKKMMLIPVDKLSEIRRKRYRKST